MEKYTGNEDFGPSHYDFNFDFDVDLRLKGFDYVLLALYVVFVLPFALIAEIALQSRHNEGDTTKNNDWRDEFLSSCQQGLCAAPCCPWPRANEA